MEKKNRLEWIYSSRDNQELVERYDQWAEDYDFELDQDYGWQAPQIVAEVATRYVSKDARILDAGAGTGLLGQCLHQEGYQDLVAIDLSEGMLEKARKKAVYGELHKMVLGERLDFKDDSFEAVFCVGVFTFGHAPASSLDELVRVTKPGGHIIFSQRCDAHEALGFKEKQEALQTAGRWKWVEISDCHRAFSKKESDVLHQVWVYQIL